MPNAFKPMRQTLALIVLAVTVAPATAQEAAATPWAREVIPSVKLNEQRTIYVATPEGYRQSSERYAVLVLLDANDHPQFAAAVANAAFLASRNAIPPLIIVGVTNGKDRTHDMTPRATGATARDFPTAGGADAFAAFISDEVLPMIRQKYRTLRATILAGHSFGGIFALHVAATRPELFAGVIAVSPSLWWNDSTAVTTYADRIARSGAGQRIFATSGALEPAIDRPTQRFAARLDSLKPAAVAFAYRHYPEDDHGLTPASSLTDGLRFVFESVSIAKLAVANLGPKSDSAAVVKALTETEETYARNARALGLPEKLPESVLNNLGYGVLLTLKLPDLAIWVFQKNVGLYPESANVYDSLADALLAKGDTTGATTQFRRAVDVATRTGHPVLAESRAKLDRLVQPPQPPQPVQAGRPKPE